MMGRAAQFLTSGKRTYATWNPADKGTAISLSNGNLTTTQTTASGLVRSTIGVSSGKWYWEITVGSAAMNAGAASGVPSSSNWCGQDTASWGYYSADGKIYNNNAGTAFGGTYANGDVIGFALDGDVATLYIYKNGVLQGTFVSLGFTTNFACIGNTGSADVATANFGASPFAYTPRAGHNSGLYTS